VKYTVEMASRAIMYILCFMKIGSDIQRLSGGYTHADTDRQNTNFMSLLVR
jgi:hypothetical protein